MAMGQTDCYRFFSIRGAVRCFTKARGLPSGCGVARFVASKRMRFFRSREEFAIASRFDAVQPLIAFTSFARYSAERVE